MPEFAGVTLHNEVVHIVLAGSPSKEVFESEFLRPLDGLLAAKIPFSLVVDATAVSGVSMSVAWAMIKWMREKRPTLTLYLRATGVVLVNEAVRAIMEFVFGMQPPVAPLKITPTTTDAWNFVKSVEVPHADS